MSSLSRFRTLAVGALGGALCAFGACQPHVQPPATPPPTLAVIPEAPLPVGPVQPPTFAAPQWQRAPGPPLTLTASDGSGLTLTRLSAHAVVAEPLAFTELHLAFDNPRDRTIEGTFAITLPPRAAIARFAMLTSGGWQEGEVVELAAARRAYEDFLHRKQDPALLEQGAGNQFTARVFPIPARARKELIVSYAEELPQGAPYALPLKGLPEVDELEVSVSGDGVAGQTYRETRTTPAGDLVFDRRAAEGGQGVRNGKMVVARVKPLGDANAMPDPVSSLMVLVDTSGSRALGFREETRLVEDLVKAVAEKTPSASVKVACYDQSVEPIFDGPASGFGEREAFSIEDRAALGASNLGLALAWAKEHSSGAVGPLQRVVVVTDGVATAGPTDAEHLRAAARALKEVSVSRLDVVAVGGIRDEAALKGLVTAGLSKDGVVVDAGLGVPRILQKLGAATRSGVPVRVEGASFAYPTRFDGVQPGDEVLVYADVGDAPAVKVSVDGGPAVPVAVGSVDAPLLERAFTQARIASLIEREATEGKSDDLKAKIVDLAVAHRIVTPYTALLVLETDADFARYDIARRGLSDILTVDGGRVVASSRAPRAPHADKAIAKGPLPAASTMTAASTPARPERVTTAPPPPTAEDIAQPSQGGSPAGATASAAEAPAVAQPAPPPMPSPASAALSPQPVADARSADTPADGFGAGGLGLSGVGESAGGQGEGIGLGNIGGIGHGAGTGAGQGFGNGHGRLSGSHQSSAPSIRTGAMQVNGRLPPEVIQRIVRQSFGRFRLCYEVALRQSPNVHGRVAVRFVIDKDGNVSSAANAGSEVSYAPFVQCVVRSFGNLSFPPPEGGVVTVVYPILFSPGETRSGPYPTGPGFQQADKPQAENPYSGKMLEVMQMIAHKDLKGARGVAQRWHDEDPGDILGLVALGEALEAGHEDARAARAYGSLIDLFPARADMRRFAGSRLERVKTKNGEPLALALDSYAKADEQRPDHPSSHRLLAYALLKSGAPEKAFDAAVDGLKRSYPEDRFPGVHQILQEDVGLIAAAWARLEPKRRAEIFDRVKEVGGTIENAPSLRFVLTWETDANDVDFHIFDAQGGHAFYQRKHLPSGGDLYADITTGYGPECFTIRGPKERRSAEYKLQANYYSRGPMGYGMGKLEVIDHDGNGHLTFDERPYVVMIDHAFVDLGTVKK